jgi:hypothetical protein
VAQLSTGVARRPGRLVHRWPDPQGRAGTFREHLTHSMGAQHALGQRRAASATRLPLPLQQGGWARAQVTVVSLGLVWVGTGKLRLRFRPLGFGHRGADTSIQASSLASRPGRTSAGASGVGDAVHAELGARPGKQPAFADEHRLVHPRVPRVAGFHPGIDKMYCSPKFVGVLLPPTMPMIVEVSSTRPKTGRRSAPRQRSRR